MLFLILTFVVIALGFLLVHSMDQRRWHRYKFERDMFFHDHPYVLQCDEKFEFELHVPKTIQKKLINVLLLKTDQQRIVRKAIIQRDAEKHQPNSVKVILCDLPVANLEPYYAERFYQSLINTDFSIGRPIEVSAEILLCNSQDQKTIQHIYLDLPENPRQANQCLIDQAAGKLEKAKNPK